MEVSLQSLRASSIPQKAVKLELVAYNSPRANLRRILNVTNNAAELAAIYNNPVSVTYFDRHNDLIQRAGEYKTLADLDSEYGEVNYKVMFHAIGNDENFSDMIKTHAHTD